MPAEKIGFLCPKCNVEVESEASQAGKTSKCPACDQSINVPLIGILPGHKYGSFTVEKRLGIGGMGEVWLAHQDNLDRHVALKILSPTLTKDAEFVERFLKEAKMAAKFEHPHIISAYDAGFDKGVYFLATNYVEGEELAMILDKAPHLPEREALSIAHSVGGALRDAWNKHQMMHRDIKPANIMITFDKSVQIMDMGIAKCANEETGLTMTGMMMGTPYYMSPEQAKGEKNIDFRTDIYALGATMYQMLTGDVPFNSHTAMGILTKHLTEPLPEPRELNSLISEQCSALIKKMMAKDREERQGTWEEVLNDIDRVKAGQYPLGAEPPKNFLASKKIMLIAVAAIALLIAGVALLSSLSSEDKDKTHTEERKAPSKVEIPVKPLKAIEASPTASKVPAKEIRKLVQKPIKTEKPVENVAKNIKPVKEVIKKKKSSSEPEKETKLESKNKKQKQSKLLKEIMRRLGYDLDELLKDPAKRRELAEKEYRPMQAAHILRRLNYIKNHKYEELLKLSKEEKKLLKTLVDALKRSKKKMKDWRDKQKRPRDWKDRKPKHR